MSFDLFRTELKKNELRRAKRKYINSKLYENDLKKIRKLTKEQKKRIYDECELWMDMDEKREMNEYIEKYTHSKYVFSIPFIQTVLKMVLIVSIVIGPPIGWGYYIFQKNYRKPIDDQQIQIMDHLVVKLIGDDSLKSGEVQDYIKKMIQQQPEYLLNNCQTIYVCSKEKFKEFKEAENLENAYAFSTYSDRAVYVQLSTKDYDTKSLTHELWHIYDFTHGDPTTDSSNLEDFQKLYKENPNSITEYGSTSSREFFAEAGVMYIYEPEQLLKQNVDVYYYFDALDK